MNCSEMPCNKCGCQWTVQWLFGTPTYAANSGGTATATYSCSLFDRIDDHMTQILMQAVVEAHTSVATIFPRVVNAPMRVYYTPIQSDCTVYNEQPNLSFFFTSFFKTLPKNTQ